MIFRIFPVEGGLFSLRDATWSVDGANTVFYSSRAIRWFVEAGPDGIPGERGLLDEMEALNAKRKTIKAICFASFEGRIGARGHRSSRRRRNVQPLNPGIMRSLDLAGWMTTVAEGERFIETTLIWSSISEWRERIFTAAIVKQPTAIFLFLC